MRLQETRLRRALPLSAVLVGVLLAACRGSAPAGGPLSFDTGEQDPVRALQRINEAGVQCWFRSRDRSFAGLNMVPELDTRVGRPRILLLERGKAEGLPVLVIEASGSPVTIDTYGPLAATQTGGRVNADIVRWSSGRQTCSG